MYMVRNLHWWLTTNHWQQYYGLSTEFLHKQQLRLQHWAVQLSVDTYNIVFQSTLQHVNADTLSRLPLNSSGPVHFMEARVCNIRQIESLPVIASHILKVLQFTKSCWPGKVPEELKPYHTRCNELTLEEGCLLWGMKVIIQHLQELLLRELHWDQPGVSHMKAFTHGLCGGQTWTKK